MNPVAYRTTPSAEGQFLDEIRSTKRPEAPPVNLIVSTANVRELLALTRESVDQAAVSVRTAGELTNEMMEMGERITEVEERVTELSEDLRKRIKSRSSSSCAKILLIMMLAVASGIIAVLAPPASVIQIVSVIAVAVFSAISGAIYNEQRRY